MTTDSKQVAVRVCAARDIECGSNPRSWCSTCPNHPSKQVADTILADERAKFSAWTKSENFNTNWHSVAKFFTSQDTQIRWEVWQAAALARSQPQGEPVAFRGPDGKAAIEILRRAMTLAGVQDVQRGMLTIHFSNEWNKTLGK